MTPDERRAVAGVLAYGCVGDLPDGVHVSLDLHSRLTGMSKDKILESLANVRSLNVKVRVRDPIHDLDEGELTPNDRDLLLSFWTPGAPDWLDQTRVAYQTVRQAARHFCAEHGLEVLDRLDFRLLSSSEIDPLPSSRADQHDTS